MNKIYIVSKNLKSRYDIISSFSSEELAKAFIENKLIEKYQFVFSSTIACNDFVENFPESSEWVSFSKISLLIQNGISFDLILSEYNNRWAISTGHLLHLYNKFYFIKSDKDLKLLKIILEESFYDGYEIKECSFVHELS